MHVLCERGLIVMIETPRKARFQMHFSQNFSIGSNKNKKKQKTNRQHKQTKRNKTNKQKTNKQTRKNQNKIVRRKSANRGDRPNAIGFVL